MFKKAILSILLLICMCSSAQAAYVTESVKYSIEHGTYTNISVNRLSANQIDANKINVSTLTSVQINTTNMVVSSMTVNQMNVGTMTATQVNAPQGNFDQVNSTQINVNNINLNGHNYTFIPIGNNTSLFYLTKDTADITTFKYLDSSNPQPEAFTVVFSTADSGNFVIQSWITQLNSPNTILIPQGIWHQHIHAQKSGFFSVFGDINLTFEGIKISSDGIITSLFTSAPSISLTGSMAEYDLSAAMYDIQLSTTDRIGFRLIANCSGILGWNWVTVEGGDNTESRLDIPTILGGESIFTTINTEIANRLTGDTNLDNSKVPYVGATNNVDVGTHTINANIITSSGNFNIGSLDTFGNRQVWFQGDSINNSKLRLGSSRADGDAINIPTQGIVAYGANTYGEFPDAITSKYAYLRLKHNRVGLFNSNLAYTGYLFKVETLTDEFYLKTDSGTMVLSITRNTNPPIMNFYGNINSNISTATFAYNASTSNYAGNAGAVGGNTYDVISTSIAIETAARLVQGSNRYSGVKVYPELIDNEDGSISISSSGVYGLYMNSIGSGPVVQVIVPSSATFVLTDQILSCVCIQFVSEGIGQFTVGPATLTNFNKAVLARIYREGNELHIISWDEYGNALAEKIQDRFVATEPFQRENGLNLSEASTGTVVISAGYVWHGIVREYLSAFNSSINRLNLYYHLGGTWTHDVSTKTYNNLYYDDGNNLVELLPNKYTVNWIYRGVEISSHAYIVLGNIEYLTVTAAQDALLPIDLPSIMQTNILVGRIIVQKGATSGLVESAFSNVFIAGNVINHNDTLNIQGGASGDYQHLTSAQVANLTQLSIDTPTIASNVAIVANNLALSSTTLQGNINGKVPYTGAIGSIDLGNYGITSSSLTISSTSTYTATLSRTNSSFDLKNQSYRLPSTSPGLQFTRSNGSYVSGVGTNIYFSTGCTMEVAMYPTQAWDTSQSSLGNTIFRKAGSGATSGFFQLSMGKWSGALSSVFFITTSSGLATINKNIVPSTGTWSRFTATWDGATVTLYIGTTSIHTALVGGMAAINSNLFYLNDPSASDNSNVKLDEVKIYNYCKTLSQLQAETSTEITDGGLVLYWKLDENTGLTTADSSNSNITGTLSPVVTPPTWTTGYGVYPLTLYNSNIASSKDNVPNPTLELGDGNQDMWLYGKSINFVIGGTTEAVVDTVNNQSVGGTKTLLNDLIISSNVYITGAASKLSYGSLTPSADVYFKHEDDRFVSDTTMNIYFLAFNATAASCPKLNLVHARGTEDLPTVTLAGDELGELNFLCRNSNNFWIGGASVKAYSLTNQSATSSDGYLQFWTTPTGSYNQLCRMTIRENGYVGVNSTAPVAMFNVNNGSVAITGTNANISVDGNTHLGYGTTDYINVTSSGITTFVGTACIPYASMYADDISSVTIIVVAGGHYPVTGGLTAGRMYGFTFVGSSYVVCNIKGMYLVNWGLSITCTAANQTVEGCVMINSTSQFNTVGAGEVVIANKNIEVGGSGIIALNVGDTVRFCLENETGTNDITVTHANMTLVQIGG